MYKNLKSHLFQQTNFAMEFSNLVTLAIYRAKHQFDRIAFTFLKDGEKEIESITFGELEKKARIIAAQLQVWDMQGKRALLLYQPGLEFISAFFGCLFAGVIPIPVYPPTVKRKSFQRLEKIALDSTPSLIITTEKIFLTIKNNNPDVTSALQQIRYMFPATIKETLAENWQVPLISTDSLAFLQYTSSSTGSPKGVMVSHGNILHNEEIIKRSFVHSDQTIVVGWLPPYHDMGLIGNILQPFYLGVHAILMAPLAFLQKPIRWLQAISDYSATTSGGPNFAYELCLQHITIEQKSGLDLSRWQVAFNGSEVIRADTLKNFINAFKECGFHQKAFFPCYGLAEATLFVAGSHSEQNIPMIECIDQNELKSHRFIPSNKNKSNFLELVGMNYSDVNHKIAIVDPNTHLRCRDGEIGEIWIDGPSVTLGYWNQPEITLETFRAVIRNEGSISYLRTGDLGTIFNGKLFITGRIKEIIIIRGLNYYPQDIEYSIQQSHLAFKNNSGAAFSVNVNGVESLVILQEISRNYINKINIASIIDLIKQVVSENYELQIYAIVLIKPATLPKTGTGKIQRHICKEQFLNKSLKEIYHYVFDPEDFTTKILVERELLLKLNDIDKKQALTNFLCNYFSKVTSRKKNIKPHDQLTALGLDSLRAVELKHRLETDLGFDYPLEHLLEGPTIKELAIKLAEQLSSKIKTSIIPSNNQLISKNHTLSFNQKAMWFLNKLYPERSAYNIGIPLKIKSIEKNVLRETLIQLLKRHFILKMVYNEQKQSDSNSSIELTQSLSNTDTIPINFIDSFSWDEKTLKKRMLAAIDQHIDLRNDPAFRVEIFQQNEQNSILLFIVHHIAVDLWSLLIILEEFCQLYSALANNQSIVLPPLRYNYLDYVDWQTRLLNSEHGEQLWAYWQKQLSGHIPYLNLPTSKWPSETQSNKAAAYNFQLSFTLLTKLRILAQTSTTTLYTILLAAYQVLLHRYTGQDDIWVGSPAAGRSRAEFNSIVGNFINTIVLRGNLANNPSFNDYLKQVKVTVLEAIAHQDFPFHLLVERLHPDRNRGVSPLFQTLFALHNPHSNNKAAPFILNNTSGHLRFGTLDVENYPLERAVLQEDLSLFLVETKDGLLGRIEYNTGLFDEDTIKGIAQHYQCLLENIIMYPDQGIDDISMISLQEQRLILKEWQQLYSEYPIKECLHHLFEKQVGERKDAIAVKFENQSLSYAELNAKANQLAHYLIILNIKPGMRIGICLERSLEMIIVMLGILKAGAIYVPLESDIPADRLAYITKDADLEVIITQKTIVEKITDYKEKIINLEDVERQISSLSEKNPDLATLPTDGAYVIYTSGTTGVPNGVQASHYNVTRLLRATEPLFGFKGEDVWTLFHSFSFDFSVWEIWGALAYGGKLIIVPYWISRSPAKFHQLLIEEKVTILNQTPSAFKQLIPICIEYKQIHNLQLRYVIFGGETLKVRDLKSWIVNYGDEQPQLVNMYGITETTIHVTYQRIKAQHLLTKKNIIGKPIPDLQIYLLDNNLKCVGVGPIGEIYISGAGVTNGYYNKPELTAKKFISNPYKFKKNQKQLYRSGDLGRYLPDGNIEYLGRSDQQIKLRGYRIELSEIETILCQQPNIEQAVVTIKDDHIDDKRLIAYIIPNNQITISIQLLQDKLKYHLPDYMIPTSFIILDKLPLTSNGKIDYKTLLLSTATEELNSNSIHIAPQTEIEKIITQIWVDILELDQISTSDKFFDLGGHSLLATQTISRIRDIYGLDIEIKTLFEKDITGLAKLIEVHQQSSKSLQNAFPLVPITRTNELKLSFAQQRLWFLEQLNGPSPNYNVPIALKLIGNLDVNALINSIKEIIDRHEALRTAFVNIEGIPAQAIREKFNLEMPLTKIQSITKIDQENEIQQLAFEEGRRLFDINSGVLIRARLLQLTKTEHVLLITMHHIASDGWSIGVLVHELSVLYNAYVRGETSPLPKLPIQYVDYTYWQHQSLQGPELKRQLAYWQEYLTDLPPVSSLPLDYQRPLLQSYKGGIIPIQIPSSLVKKLLVLGHKEGTTLFMLLISAFNILISRYSGQQDVAVGWPIANRTHSKLEKLIGFFVNTMVLRTKIHNNIHFDELLKQVKHDILNAYQHQDLPFEHLVDVLQPERSLSHQPLFQVLFILQNAPLEELILPNLEIIPLQVDYNIAKFDLTVNVRETPEGLIGYFEYNADLFKTSTIERMIEHYKTLLNSIVENYKQNVYRLQILTEAERQQILNAWNTPHDYYSTKCAHELFEQQVLQTPDAIAVCFNDYYLSYSELNSKANQLAHYLIARGVKPEISIGICVERSLEMVIGILGILKAGGAYVGLDPTYPIERLNMMLEDSQTKFLLTQEKLKSKLNHSNTICLDTDWKNISYEENSNPHTKSNIDNLLLIIYTSGSTGKPKGVALSHKALVNVIKWHPFSRKVSDGGILQFFSLSTDNYYTEMFTALCTGTTLHIIPEELRLQSEELLTYLMFKSVHKVNLPVVILQQWAQDHRQQPHLFQHFTNIIATSEQLQITPAIIELFKKLGNCTLHNHYGPTESHVSVAYEFKDHPENWPYHALIGSSTPNCQNYILNENMSLQPIGIVGELYIGGIQLARNYFNRPDLTAEKFIPNPFSSIPGERLYKTGDLARYLADGNIEYVGRIDQMVKIRGYRIELDEVEAVLNQHPKIQQGIIAVKGEEAKEKFLVAYYISKTDANITVTELHEYMQKKLPDFMVPSIFMNLDKFPLTPNNKVDKKLLPEPNIIGQTGTDYIAPSNAIEKTIAKIWSELLKVEQISIYDNFFHLGGHSLLAIQFVNRISQTLSIKFSVQKLFEKPTINELAELITQESDYMSENLNNPWQEIKLSEEDLKTMIAAIE